MPTSYEIAFQSLPCLSIAGSGGGYLGGIFRVQR